MTSLNTQYVFLPPPTTQSFSLPKPISYEFRVAEHLNENDTIVKVALQVQVWEHDQFGYGSLVSTWMDVPRVKFKNGVEVT